MKTRSLLVGMTLVNVVLLVFSLAQSGAAVMAQGSLPILRGRGLEIVDDAGRVRASITLLPADPNVKMPDGTTGYPETVLLRLINSKGRPNIKIAATEKGSGLLVAGDTDPTHVEILADGPNPTIKLSNQDGAVQILKP